MKLTIDFETRSPVDIKKCGAYKYAEHEWTDVMCLCVMADDGPVQLWVPQFVQGILGDMVPGNLITTDQLEDLIDRASIIEAHNVEFERAIWNSVMVRYGFGPLPEPKLRCSAAKAAIFGVPRSLGKACAALNLPQQKDDEGNKVMMKLTSPCRPVKKERERLESSGWVETATKNMWLAPDGSRHWFFKEEPKDYLRMIRYCEQDVIAEHCLSAALPEMSESALELWRIDQLINTRGVRVDTDGCRAMIAMCESYKEAIDNRLSELTQGAVTKGTKVQPMLAWLESRGCKLWSLDADAIGKALDRTLAPDVRELLTLRQSYAKASVAKYEAALRHCTDEGRIKGMFLFHGAHTGRWSGRGMQLQNLPSRGICKDPETILRSVKSGASLDFIELMWDSPLAAASSCVRSVLCAAPGHELLVADYSAIEGRILAWLAGEEYILQAYRDDKDTYKIAASSVYGVDYDKVTGEQRQVGKVIELACGFQGYVGAFQAMAKGYGLELPEDMVKDTVMAWRNSRPMTVKLWAELQRCMELAILNPTKAAQYRKLRFNMQDGHLRCRLPSGRILWYPFAEVKPGHTPWGKECYIVSYMTQNSVTQKWERTETYGGKMAENVTQAVSADLIAHALVLLHKSGWHPVLHVHDETGCEEVKGERTVDELCDVMCTLPPWATDLPVVAKGWKGERYRK